MRRSTRWPPLLVDVELYRTDAELRVTVRDNGVGLPAGFSIDETTSLGLSIVRDLVAPRWAAPSPCATMAARWSRWPIPVDHPIDDLASLR